MKILLSNYNYFNTNEDVSIESLADGNKNIVSIRIHDKDSRETVEATVSLVDLSAAVKSFERIQEEDGK